MEDEQIVLEDNLETHTKHCIILFTHEFILIKRGTVVVVQWPSMTQFTTQVNNSIEMHMGFNFPKVSKKHVES
jgi:hypothetical protein